LCSPSMMRTSSPYVKGVISAMINSLVCVPSESWPTRPFNNPSPPGYRLHSLL
jgi:hypothetical protein